MNRAPLPSVLIACALTICSAGAYAQDPVATVNGEAITRQMLADRLLSEFGKNLIDDLIDELLVTQEAKRLNLQVTEAEVDARLALQKQLLPPGVKWESMLLERRFTPEAFRERMRTLALLEKLVAPTIKVPPEAIGSLLLQQPDLFNIPNRVQLRGIKKINKAQAEQVRRVVIGKVDTFENVARNFSEDDATKRQGGDLGWMPITKGIDGRSVLDRFGIKAEKGIISEVIAGEDGYWVYQVVDFQAGKIPPLEERKRLARQFLFDDQVRAAAVRYFDELKRKARIERPTK